MSPFHYDILLISCQWPLYADAGGRGLGGVELVYKTPPAVTKEGLSTVSVSMPYDSVVSVWDRAGTTDEERRTGEGVS